MLKDEKNDNEKNFESTMYLSCVCYLCCFDIFHYKFRKHNSSYNRISILFRLLMSFIGVL